MNNLSLHILMHSRSVRLSVGCMLCGPKNTPALFFFATGSLGLYQHVMVNYRTSNDWKITSERQVRRSSGFSMRLQLSHLSSQTFIWLPTGQTVQPPDPNVRSSSCLWPLGVKSKPATSSQHQLPPQSTIEPIKPSNPESLVQHCSLTEIQIKKG